MDRIKQLRAGVYKEERGSDGSDVVTFCLEDNSRHIVIASDCSENHSAPTEIENVPNPEPSAQKILRNGQVLIQRGDKLYTLTGQEVK